MSVTVNYGLNLSAIWDTNTFYLEYFTRLLCDLQYLHEFRQNISNVYKCPQVYFEII